MDFNELIAMKKSSKRPQEGDVFVLQPIEGIFYYGKVIKTNLISTDSFINGMLLIYIYQYSSVDKAIPHDLENEEFLISPMIVNYQPWRKGYFETIGNIEVSEKERNADFAFWDVLTKKYVDTSGQVVKNKPKYWSIYGLGSYGIVGKMVQESIKQKDHFNPIDKNKT